jgi:hypothetical protein
MLTLTYTCIVVVVCELLLLTLKALISDGVSTFVQ